MRHIRTLICFCALAVLTANSALAQYTKEWNPWPVLIDGDTVVTPFLGGINSPKPSLVDFDGDGLTDLMLGESRGKIVYFENIGSASVPQWAPVQERLGGIDIGTWHTFCDIDADGDLDLFGDAKNGQVAFYRNETVGSNISFVLVDETFGDFLTGFNNTCEFADIDDDGDFDFFWGSGSGALSFWRNDGDSANSSFAFIDDFYDSILAFPGAFAASAQHGFSSIEFVDVDLDFDLDLFYGDIFNSNMYYFENLGTPSLSDLTKLSEDYLPAPTFGFNHPTFADLDNDADIDMIVGAAQQDFDNLLFYRRSGSTYAVEDSNVIQTFDLGSYAVPALGDLDGDDDLDMLVGGVNGRLIYFENVGTATAPSFVQMSDFYKGIDVGLSAAPALTDWDCDGDLDLLIGTDAGRIQFWRNEGSPTNFDPVMVTSQLAGIKVDQLATPRPVDLNGDNLRDLVVGEWDFNGKANVQLYQNNGNSPDPVLSLVTTALLPRTARDFTLPQVYDWDGDGKKDLIVGGRFFGYQLFRNTAPMGQFPDSLTFAAQPDSLPGYDDGYRLAIAFADIDGDDDLDVFVGEEEGGVNFHRRDGVGTPCLCAFPCDFDGDSFNTALDLGSLIDILFAGIPDLQDPECPIPRGDFDCDGFSTALDLGELIDHLFAGSPGPCNPCLTGTGCP
jgi:hypothetical protein